MKYYYGRKNNKLIKLAKIYTSDEHNINKKNIDFNAAWIIRTLKNNGHTAYIVGGSIRDFLVGKIPKDFDIVTSAHPNQIKKLFKRSQIIGKRFPIVIVYISKNEFIEISTFRSDEDNNGSRQVHKKRVSKKAALKQVEFGNIDQDVKRRDFTCNALYYDIDKEDIIDFVNGVEHIREKKLIAVRTEFTEDPVRMIRAVKYASKIHLTIPRGLQLKIKRNAKLLESVSSSRKGDEVIKILISGVSREIVEYLFSYKLLCYILPEVDKWYMRRKERKNRLLENLSIADSKVEEKYSRIRGLQMLMQEYVLHIVKSYETDTHKKNLNHKDLLEILSQVQSWLYPITLPNVELQKSIISVLQSQKLVSSHLRRIISRPRSIRYNKSKSS